MKIDDYFKLLKIEQNDPELSWTAQLYQRLRQMC